MELHQLKYFTALAKERHFQKAADTVHITQPTLSQQIQKLEKELGVYLFERSPRQVKLTAEGERFFPHAVAILDAVARAEEEVKDKGDEPTGRVVLGVIPTIGAYLLPPVIRAMRQAAPKVTLELNDLTTSVLLQQLKEGRIQMGILALPVSDRGIASRAIGKESFYLAVPTKHALAKKARVRVKDFSEEQLLILQEGHCFREQSLEYCKLAKDSPQIVFQGSSLGSVMRLAAAGEGVTFVPQMAALPAENPGLKFIPFAAPEPARELGIVWRMSTPLTRAHSLLMNIIEAEFLKLTSQSGARSSRR